MVQADELIHFNFLSGVRDEVRENVYDASLLSATGTSGGKDGKSSQLSKVRAGGVCDLFPLSALRGTNMSHSVHFVELIVCVCVDVRVCAGGAVDWLL